MTLKSCRSFSSSSVCLFKDYLLDIMPVLAVAVLCLLVIRGLDVEGKTGSGAIKGEGDLFEGVSLGLDHDYARQRQTQG